MTLTSDGRRKIVEDLRRKAMKMEREAKKNAPVDTGRLRSSITNSVQDRGSTVEVRIGTNVEYAPFIEFGVDPYKITPDDAEALRFEVDGEVVFAQEVQHPGFPAMPFLRPAVRKVLREG